MKEEKKKMRKTTPKKKRPTSERQNARAMVPLNRHTHIHPYKYSVFSVNDRHQ